MAVDKEKRITVGTFDNTYRILQSDLMSFFEPDFQRWEWLKEVRSKEAEEYYFTHIRSAKETLALIANSSDSSTSANLNSFVAPTGELGTFIFQTKHLHGALVAFYTLQIATSAPDESEALSFNKSEALRKSATYEYHLAHYLYFQHINAADYIIDNTNKKLMNVAADFAKQATVSLERIDRSADQAHEIIMTTNDEHNKIRSKLTKRHSRRVRRYRQVFESVRREAASTRESANNDLKNAYQTYHQQVDLKASVIYWEEKITQHNRSSGNWLKAVIISILLTFLLPVIYYASGGVSTLATWKNHSTTAEVPVSTTTTPRQNPDAALQLTNKEQSPTTSAATKTIENVAFASGIADLTGAALLVTLLSVILRICLRQYNICKHLGHDAEERVTMMKTYLALSNEGKLTSDGDMKLVLDALFRGSQTNGIVDTTPATPIELIIKAITERK